MRHPSVRSVRLLKWATPVVGFLASGAIIAQSSSAAFTASTSNPTNNWAVGSVAISDDDANTAMFSATGLKPGSTGTKCIAVTSTGTLPSPVKLYGTAPATTNSLSSHITLTIVQGNGGTFADCTDFQPISTGSSVYTGTLANFGTTATNYATGLGNWAPTGTAAETRVYQVTYTVVSAAPSSTQGGTASIGFTWETQNT